jgi:hypothetical protein
MSQHRVRDEADKGMARKAAILVVILLAIVGAVSASQIGSAGAIEGGVAQPSGNVSFARFMYKGVELCSGTVVSQDWILTAAHCFDESNPNPNKTFLARYSEVTVQLWQGAVGSSTGWTSHVDKVLLDPAYLPQAIGGNHDLALVHTSRKMPEWAVALPLADSDVAVTPGEGLTDYAWGETTFGVQSSASSTVVKSPDGSLTALPTCPSELAEYPGALCLNEGGATRLIYGDSGSAILSWTAGGWQIVSVFDKFFTTPGWAETTSVLATQDTELDRQWVETTIGAPDVPTDSIVTEKGGGSRWLVLASIHRILT